MCIRDRVRPVHRVGLLRRHAELGRHLRLGLDLVPVVQVLHLRGRQRQARGHGVLRVRRRRRERRRLLPCVDGAAYLSAAAAAAAGPLPSPNPLPVVGLARVWGDGKAVQLSGNPRSPHLMDRFLIASRGATSAEDSGEVPLPPPSRINTGLGIFGSLRTRKVGGVGYQLNVAKYGIRKTPPRPVPGCPTRSGVPTEGADGNIVVV